MKEKDEGKDQEKNKGKYLDANESFMMMRAWLLKWACTRSLDDNLCGFTVLYCESISSSQKHFVEGKQKYKQVEQIKRVQIRLKITRT